MVLSLAKEGKNLFVTGGAGTGKSALISEINRTIGKTKRICITSTTGFSAFYVKGVTINSWSGIGLGNESADAIVKKTLKNSSKSSIIRTTDILIIDEISMLGKKTFDLIENVVRRIRGCSKTFGGIQVIAVGDMCQLPPVSTNSNIEYPFESSSWSKIFTEPYGETIELKEIFRQKDVEFMEFLNRVRLGVPTIEDKNLLLSKVVKNYSITPNCLYLECKRDDVAKINRQEVSKLKGKTIVYTADVVIREYTKPNISLYKQQVINRTPISQNLELKIGAEVILNHNIDLKNGLVNGLRGKVVGFKIAKLASFSEVDYIIESDIPEQLDQDKERKILGVNSASLELPIVQFLGKSNVLIYPHRWNVEFKYTPYKTGNKTFYKQEPIVIVKQLPLNLGYALTMHRVQGLTITDPVKINLTQIFDGRQIYVALSRSKTFDFEIKGRVSDRLFNLNNKVKEFQANITKKNSNYQTLLTLLKIKLVCLDKGKNKYPREIIFLILSYLNIRINATYIEENMLHIQKEKIK